MPNPLLCYDLMTARQVLTLFKMKASIKECCLPHLPIQPKQPNWDMLLIVYMLTFCPSQNLTVTLTVTIHFGGVKNCIQFIP